MEFKGECNDDSQSKLIKHYGTIAFREILLGLE